MKIAEDLRRAVLQAGIEGRLTGGRCEGWRFVRLGDVTYNHGQKKPDCDFYYIDVGSIDNKKCQLGDNDIVISPEKASSRARKIIKQNDVIYALIRPYLHNICIVNRSYSKEVIASTAFAVMHCREEILTRYLYYVLLSPMFDKYANAPDKSRGVAYPAIGERDFLNGIISLPPLNEQHRIVSRLDSILPLIAELESAENELEAIERRFPGDMRDSLLQAAIEGKLTGGTEGWRWVRLGECTSIIMGQSPKSEYVNNSVGMEFHQGKIFFGDKVIQDSKLRTSVAHKIAPADSALLSVRAPVGKVNITDREICIGRGLAALKGHDGMPTEFIYYVLQSLEQSFNAKATGTTFKAITASTIYNQLIPLPPLEQQHKIVSRLNKLLPLCKVIEETAYNE